MERKKIKDKIVTWSGYELDGKIPDVILKLTKLMEVNPNHFDFELSVESNSEYYGACSTAIDIDAYRWETDEEAEKRIIASKKASEAAKIKKAQEIITQEKRERTLYESLKKKFEKEIDESMPQPPK